ncbi:hypothetical protein AAVH_08204 [Aphelenchoides avenae]|nr:hypothetical protein AAVH_08204 [Aphelenchus avenae]
MDTKQVPEVITIEDSDDDLIEVDAPTDKAEKCGSAASGNVTGEHDRYTPEPNDPFNWIDEDLDLSQYMKDTSGDGNRGSSKPASKKAKVEVIDLEKESPGADKDSDENVDLDLHASDLEMIDFRDTSDISVSSKLDYLEVLEVRLAKGKAKQAKDGRRRRGNKKHKGVAKKSARSSGGGCNCKSRRRLFDDDHDGNGGGMGDGDGPASGWACAV